MSTISNKLLPVKYTCMFCENIRTKCYSCMYCENILCEECCFGDDITPKGVAHYCCDNNNNKYQSGIHKYKKIK